MRAPTGRERQREYEKPPSRFMTWLARLWLRLFARPERHRWSAPPVKNEPVTPAAKRAAMFDPYADSRCLRCGELPFPPHGDVRNCKDGKRHVVKEAPAFVVVVEDKAQG